MSNMQIEGVLAQIRAMQQQTKLQSVPQMPDAGLAGAQGVTAGSQVSFAKVLQQGLEKVNATQLQASDMATRFERGEPGLELSQVMIESQKATVSLRATVEVRNRLVSAYQEIMNMPI